jgi:integrase
MHRAMPVIDLFTDAYVPLRLGGCSRNTKSGFFAAIRGLERYWHSKAPERVAEKLPLGEWNKLLTAGYLAELIEKRSRATRNKHLRHLLAVWNFGRELADEIATETGEHPGLFRLPLSLEFVKEDTDAPECWSQEEFARLLVAAAETKGYIGDCPARYWWPSLILLAYSTGVRIEALMQIRSADLDLTTRWVIVRGRTQKDKEGQPFSLQEDTCGVLARMKPERNELVFGDWPFSIRTLTEHYREIIKRAGLPDTRKDLWHKLRRTFGTEVARSAGEIVAQTLLGHSHISVTRRYIDPKKLDKPSAADLIRPPSLPMQLRLFKPRGDEAAEAG